MVFRDSGPHYRSKLVRTVLEGHLRLDAHRYPGDSPELNPDSGSWAGILMCAGGFGMGFCLFVLFSRSSNVGNYVGSGIWNSNRDILLSAPASPRINEGCY